MIVLDQQELSHVQRDSVLAGACAVHHSGTANGLSIELQGCLDLGRIVAVADTVENLGR
jgi:hypothetical protein